jgi:hypothetical protein
MALQLFKLGVAQLVYPSTVPPRFLLQHNRPHFTDFSSLLIFAGLFIVDDAPGEVPSELAEMTEVIMVIQHFDLRMLQDIQRLYNADSFWQVQGDLKGETEMLLVNGQREPVLEVNAGVWYRFRTVLIGNQISGHFAMDSNICEMQLLAKDGVYLEWMPRSVSELYLAPGSRSDFAVRCIIADVKSINLMSRIAHFPPGSLSDSTATVLTLVLTPTNVPSSASNVAPDLTIVHINRPCYLASTLKAPKVDSSHFIDLGTGGGNHINFIQYSESNDYLAEWETGQLVEVRSLNIYFFPMFFNMKAPLILILTHGFFFPAFYRLTLFLHSF